MCYIYSKAERTKKETLNVSTEICWKVTTLKTEKKEGG
jgi:hypothetical protein